MIRYSVILLLAFTVTGCAVYETSARHHGNAANEASKRGDWTTARKQWAIALVNADLAGMPAKRFAVFNYEYGRALGVQCFWDEAEKYLLKAHELDLQAGGPEFMSLVELSRLKYDQKQYDKAVDYYEHAIQVLEKTGALVEAPIGFADILDEYSDTLQKTNKEAEAKKT